MRVLVDCGLVQERHLRDRNWDPFPVPPASIDAVLLTHAHLDHCGLLPKLVKEGFKGRIICSSNQNLDGKVVTGEFRKDLFYRIKSHQVELPPLRERQDDIPLLLDNFLIEAAESMGKKVPSYPDELPVLLRTYHFPGNVREMSAA